MDVVYVVGGGSKHNDAELRYSLRSIEKNGIGLGQVCIIGECPSWIDRSRLTWIPFEDNPEAAPAVNVFNKLNHAIVKGLLPDRFLLSSDDHFFIRKTDFDNYPIHYKAERLPVQKDVGTGVYGDRRYTQCMVNTARVMRWFNLPAKFYEGHTNKLYDLRTWTYLKNIGFWNFAKHFEDGISANTPMAAAFMRQHPDWPCVRRKDIKVRSFASMDDLMQQLGESNSFSIGDGAFGSGIEQVLQEWFPDSSRFEK